VDPWKYVAPSREPWLMRRPSSPPSRSSAMGLEVDEGAVHRRLAATPRQACPPRPRITIRYYLRGRKASGTCSTGSAMGLPGSPKPRRCRSFHRLAKSLYARAGGRAGQGQATKRYAKGGHPAGGPTHRYSRDHQPRRRAAGRNCRSSPTDSTKIPYLLNVQNGRARSFAAGNAASP